MNRFNKRRTRFSETTLFIALCAVFFTFFTAFSESAWAQSEIVSIEITGGEAVLTVAIEAGATYVRVETQDIFTEGDTWIPLPSIAVDGTAQTVTLTIPADRLGHSFRVACYEDNLAAAGVFSGISDFNGDLENAFTTDEARNSASPPIAVEDTAFTPGAGGDPATVPREVTDANIYAIRDDRLYFFNRNVGLQVIDISDPDTAVLLGQMTLPGRGEKLLPLSGDRVLLVGGRDCAFQPGDPESEGIIVDVSTGDPAVTTTFPIRGAVREARTVGTALYVLSHSYYNADGDYEPYTSFQTFDLAVPDQPIAVEDALLTGWSRFIHATPDRVVLGYSENYRETTLCVYDISSPVGTLVKMGEVLIADGRVADEFKVWIEDDLLAVTSQEYNSDSRRWDTAFRTFHVGPAVSAPPDDPAGGSPGTHQLGEVRMALNEQLFGSRITDERTAYIVTFERIDPLWIVDFQDPTNPTILGELEVPGFSTYLQPLGDELLSIGTESGRVAVSLFDVSDPANPTMTSRVRLGDRWSWSEAVYEEQAFTVLPESNTILVPFSSPTGTGLQFIEMKISANGDVPGLVERGFLAHYTSPRRAIEENDRFLAIDGLGVTVIDAVDRDNPEVTHQVKLSQPVTDVFVEGAFRIELNSNSVRPSLRVNPLLGAANAINALHEFDLPLGYIIATHHECGDGPAPGTLHLLQRVLDSDQLRHLVVDLSDLTAITWRAVEFDPASPVGGNSGNDSTDVADDSIDIGYYGSNYKALVPEPGILIWKTQQYGGYYYPDDPILEPAVDPAARLVILPPGYGGGTSTRLLAIDHRGAEPELVSKQEVTIPENVESWSANFECHAAAGKVYIGRSYRWYTDDVPELLPAYIEDQVETRVADGQSDIIVSMRRHDLVVIDYADPAKPVERPAIELPGRLEGVSDDGIFLYAAAQFTRNEDDGRLNGLTHLVLLSYDGAAAYLRNSIPIGNHSGNLNLIYDDVDMHLITYDAAADDRKIQRVSVSEALLQSGPSTMVGGYAYNLSRHGDLLVTRVRNEPKFFHAKTLYTLPFTSSTDGGCLYPDTVRGDGGLNGFAAPAGNFGVVEFVPPTPAPVP